MTLPHDNYNVDDHTPWSLKAMQYRVALYGRPQMVHAHGLGEEYNERCYGVFLPA